MPKFGPTFWLGMPVRPCWILWRLQPLTTLNLTSCVFNLYRYMLIVKRSVKSIRKAGLLLENEDVLRNYFNVLKLPKQIESRILATLPNDPNGVCQALLIHIYILIIPGIFSLQLTLLELRLLVLAHFLAHILQHDIKITKSLILRYPRTKHRSFSWIMENIEILRSECQFSDKMVRSTMAK